MGNIKKVKFLTDHEINDDKQIFITESKFKKERTMKIVDVLY